MELRADNDNFYIYQDDYQGERIGETKATGDLSEIKAAVFEMLKNNMKIPALPIEVTETEGQEKPTETVLLIEIERNKAYKIAPSFGKRIFTNDYTLAGGLLNIIAEAEKRLTT